GGDDHAFEYADAARHMADQRYDDGERITQEESGIEGRGEMGDEDEQRGAGKGQVDAGDADLRQSLCSAGQRQGPAEEVDRTGGWAERGEEQHRTD
ncbi:hypothetical protein LTR94_035569, partial [Friedmanniomyces endolithicus]